MYLTIGFEIASNKNDDGQGRQRRSKDIAKSRRIISRLSRRKEKIIQNAVKLFTSGILELLKWGFSHFDELPFTFPLSDKEGNPVMDKKTGQQKLALTSAHYLANWLGSRVNLSYLGFNSRIANSARNQAAETLLSQYRLRQMENGKQSRLTGPVGEVDIRSERELQLDYDRALDTLTNPSSTWDEINQAAKSTPVPKFLPMLFAQPTDFPLFQHRGSKRLFVCLPLLSRSDDMADQPVRQENKDWLAPLRPDGRDLPRSKLWILLPLRRRPDAEKLLSSEDITPRTAELKLSRTGKWRFNIVIEVPEKEPPKPEAFMGVRVGYYSIHWKVMDKNNQALDEGTFDLSPLQSIIKDAARQRSYARERGRADLFPKYRGKLKIERERVIKSLIESAVKYKAAIGVEDIAGLDKSTWNRRVNLFRSHWDFGRFVETLTYKSVLEGLPTLRRRKKRILYLLPSLIATFSCAQCGTGVSKSARTVTISEGRISCSKCGHTDDVNHNAVAVIAQRTSAFWTKTK